MKTVKKLKFTKMHGIGNDYVFVNALNQSWDEPEPLARLVSDRHFGIGSDGLVLIKPSGTADFMMDIYNMDGSQAKMCGNAIRCVGKYVYDHGLTDKRILQIETLSGIKTLQLMTSGGKVDRVSVNMGPPVFETASIPVHWHDRQIIEEPIAVAGHLYKLTCVSMGNPHAVTFLDQIDALDLSRIGPAFENHSLFPDRINTEFVQVLDRKNLRMRVWERGSGETLACGTGACAALAAAVATGRSERQTVVHLKGGDLDIEWEEASNEIIMTGPAAFVFEGWMDLSEQRPNPSMTE
jgi:diaminopimelate epimerase